MNTLHRITFLLFCLVALALSFLPSVEARVTTSATVEQAKDRAAKSKKDYLVLNYGEWDVVSMDVYKLCWKSTRELDKTLENGTILAEATFGDDLTDTQKRAQDRRNKGLRQSPPSLPSVFFFDQDGFLYATLTGSKVPRQDKLFAEAVAEIQKKRIQRDELIKNALLKKGLERAKILGEAVNIFGISASSKLLQLIKEADPSDQSGYIRRTNFDIFKLQDLLKETDEKAIEELNKKIADTGYSIEQRQMMMGLKNFIYRKKPEENAKLIADTYRKMYELGPETIMGRSGMKGLQDTFNIHEIGGQLYGKPIDEALKMIDETLANKFPYSVEQKQDLLDMRIRCMLPKADEYKDEIVNSYKEIIDLAPTSQMAEFARQEIDFLTLSPEELENRKRMSKDDINDHDEILGEEVYPDDDDFE